MLIYYQGYSEPEIAALLLKLIKPGMTFWDVGAHIGEYSLIASRLATESGHIEAFEPQPAMFEFLRANIERNSFTNVGVHDIAIADRSGEMQLSLPAEPAIATLQVGQHDVNNTTAVRVTPLDTILEITERVPNLIKIDVEGAELMVLNGATSLLDLDPAVAPIWIMEYEPANCSAFGYEAGDLLKKFRQHGFFTYWLPLTGQPQLILDTVPPRGVRTVLATKGARVA